MTGYLPASFTLHSSCSLFDMHAKACRARTLCKMLAIFRADGEGNLHMSSEQNFRGPVAVC